MSVGSVLANLRHNHHFLQSRKNGDYSLRSPDCHTPGTAPRDDDDGFANKRKKALAGQTQRCYSMGPRLGPTILPNLARIT